MVHPAASDSAELQAPLSQAVGYIVVVVIGLVIAFGMMVATKVLKKTMGEDNRKTEMYMTANRTVRTGLTTSAVISSWLWSTAMLASAVVGYDFGVAGPFWFAAGCSPMIAFFAVLGISCKRKIPEAHTLLEIVRIRYGNVAHGVWIFLCLMNNLFACANMLLGASAAITGLTGINVIAATFLLPVGVALYTLVGGIKATFLTDYIHTFTILIICCYFTVKVFTVDAIKSPAHLYDLVKAAGARHYVEGNHNGSLLTMASKSGIEFAIIHTLTNFGLVIMDTSFFIKAFAASPAAVVPGYVLGGICYFAIPWGLGTLMSSVALGLEDNPIFPTYPRLMSSTEVSKGLVLPYAAVAVAGKGGAVACVLIIFMAVTSTLSAQVIAVSSILSFDIYRTYIKPHATDRDVIHWSHIGVIFFAVFAAAFSTMLYYVGVDLTWTLYMLGVVTCPGIFPTVFTILWRRQSRLAAIIAPLLGMATGMAVWLGSAHAFYGEVTVATTGMLLPCMYGNAASALSPIIYSVVITLFAPQNWEWADFAKHKLKLEDNASPVASISEASSAEYDSTAIYSDDKKKELKRWGRIAAYWATSVFLGHWVLWPLPMYASNYIFGQGFYVAWLVVAIIWLWGTMLVAGFYPLIDGGFVQIGYVIKSLLGKSLLQQQATSAPQSVNSENDVTQLTVDLSEKK